MPPGLLCLRRRRYGAWTNGRSAARGTALLALAFGAGVGVLGLAFAAVFDPATQGCVQCPANLLRVIGEPGLASALGRAGLALTVIWIAAFAVLATVRLTRSSPARRRVAWPVLVPAVATVALYGAGAVHGLDRGFLSNDPTDRALRLAEAGGLVLVAAGVGLARLRIRRTRAALARLVLELGDAPSPGELRARLADSLGDPTLELLHRLEGGEWIDAEGRETGLPSIDGREATRLRVGGEDVLAIVHRPGLLDDPALVAELATTASLALQHERLHASLRARLEELRASRSRIVAAADAERRALERDLHDGAQQRLISVALAIRLARRTIATDDPALDVGLAAAEGGVRAAAVELRDVAHGLFPTVLADEGLRAALEELSEHAPRLVARALPGWPLPRRSRVRGLLRRGRSAAAGGARGDGGRRCRERSSANRDRRGHAPGRGDHSDPRPGRGGRRHRRCPRRRALPGDAVRVVIADDEALLREGLARLLEDAGFEVAGRCGDADALLRMVEVRRPDVAIVDIRMPPNRGDDGLLAAQEIRRRYPDMGVLVLSHYLDSRYAARLLEEVPEGAGYLLKDRISEVAVVADALRRINDGECVIDPTIVSRLVARKRARGPLDVLTEREREVLALVAEGHSNGAIGEKLFLSRKTIDAHISQIFRKLDLRESPEQHRRVLAVLAFLRAG